MKKEIIRFAIVISAILGSLVMVEGCGTNATTPITPLKDGEITADISGFGSFYAANAVADSTDLLFHVHSFVLNKDNNDSLVLDLLVTRGSSIPFSSDVSTDDNSKIAYCIIKPDGTCTNYSADKTTQGSSGQIRISSMSPTLQGTFSGTLQLVGGSGSVNISNGEFNASFH